jgi:hypothetical protein
MKIILALILIILCILALNQNMQSDKPITITKRYKVYYEYNIYNKDTIGVDTIYQLINTKP